MRECSSKMEQIRRFVSAGLVAVLLVFSLSACGSGGTQESEHRRKIAVICKGSVHEFWKTVEQGAMDAGEELGLDVTFEAPEDESQIDVQIDMVETAIADRVDAIVLAPLDVERLNSSIEEAHSLGIPVLTFDSDVTSPVRVATIGTDNKTAGAIAGRNAANLMGGKGKVAVVSFVEGAQTATERNAGFLDVLEKDYKDTIEVVGVKFCGGDAEVAKQQTYDFIKKHPDIKCIYGANEGSAVGVASAVKELGMQNDIIVIGFDSSEQEIAYLDEGVIKGMMVQNPYNMGYLGVRNINKVLDGIKIDEKLDTGATYVSRENLYDEDTQWLLYPLGKE